MSFSVIKAAQDRALLTLEELRVLAKVTDRKRDSDLLKLGLRISDLISNTCLIASDGQTPVTLLRETVSQVFRFRHCQDRPIKLFLDRRFVANLTIVEDDATDPTDPLKPLPLNPTDFEANSSSGLVTRLCSDREHRWARKVAVTYDAGFVVIPEPLKDAAKRLVQLQLSADSRDPLVKRERDLIPDVRETQIDYWVGPIDGAAIPTDVMDLLEPYRSVQ